jgi:tetratricopeptide (TPR) repeat protein
MRYILLAIPLSIIIFFCSCGGRASLSRGEAAKVFGSRAYSYFSSGDFENALYFYQRARLEAAARDLPLQQSRYTFNIGRLFYEENLPDSALHYLSNACYMLSFNGDSSSASRAAGLIALLHGQKGNFDSADLICNKYSSEKNKDLKAFWISVKARLLFFQNDYTRAQVLLDSVAHYYKKAKNNDAVAGNYLLFANVYLKTKRYSDACEILRRALMCLDKTDVQFRRWKILLTLSECSFLNGDSSSGMIYYARAKDCIPSCFTLPSLELIKCGTEGFF